MKPTKNQLGLLLLATSLSVAGSNAYALAETESNDTFSLIGSNAVASGLQTLTGAITPTQDRDIFSFSLAAGSNFSASITSSTAILGTFDINMGLFDSALQGVAGNDGSSGNLNFSVLTSGTYYLAVSAFANFPLDFFGNNLSNCDFFCYDGVNPTTTFDHWSEQSFSQGTYDIQVSSVPEPANVALMLSSLGLIGMAARRRQRQI
jgi:hypothetical protein